MSPFYWKFGSKYKFYTQKLTVNSAVAAADQAWVRGDGEVRHSGSGSDCRVYTFTHTEEQTGVNTSEQKKKQTNYGDNDVFHTTIIIKAS